MVNEQARTKITRARSQLVLYRPFFGYLSTYLDPIENNNLPMPTMGVDGKHLFYDAGFVNKAQDKELLSYICHEVMHLALGHLWRRGGRNAERWNIATDAVINLILRKEKFTVPNGAVYIPEAEKLSAEEIYMRIKEQEKIEGEVLDDHSKWGQPITSKSEVSSKGRSETEHKDKSESEEKDDESGGASSEGGKDTDGKDVDGDEESGGASSGNGGGEDKTKTSKELTDMAKSLTGAASQSKELETKWKEHVSRVRQLVKMQGSDIGDLDELINDLLEPKLDWRELLRNFILSATKSNYRIIPPSKKYLWQGIYLPSCYGESVEIAYAVDTSGSMSIDEIKEGLSELKGICQQFEDYRIWVIQCDYDIQEVKELTLYNFDFPEKIRGRGGTSHIPVFNYIEEHALDITCLVCFTDGYTTVPDARPMYPVLWVVPERGADKNDDYWNEMERIGEVVKF